MNLRLLVALGCIVLAVGDSHADQRNKVLRHARNSLPQTSHPLLHRRPSRAHADSTFARFLRSPGTSVDESYATRAEMNCSATASSPEIRVSDYGADPTGLVLSDAAFEAALAILLNRSAAGTVMANKIHDLGGAVLQLSGGTYLISKPIHIPAGFGNFKIIYGTLRAAPTFPKDRYLVEIGDSAALCKKNDPKQKSCNENVGVEDLMLDGQLVAKGGLEINATMGGNVGPDIFFIGFQHAGLTVNGGHEVMVHQSWFGIRYYDDKMKLDGVNGTFAIEFYGNDHVASDIIVFSSQTGLITTGGANVIEGLHTWNDGTGRGGHGIIVRAPSTRLDKVYLDYTSLVIEDPTHVSVSNSFFLGMGTVVLKSTKGTIDGLVMTANSWNNANMPANRTIVLDERGGIPFHRVNDFVMMGNVGTTTGAHTMAPAAVTVTKILTQASSKRFEFDFSDTLLFPHIGIVAAKYSIQINGTGFAQHALRPANGLTIAVETDTLVDATVVLTATQGTFSAGNNW